VARKSSPTSAPASVYRAFDESGELLYVGMSSGPRERFNQHAKDRPWWDEVARIEVERFPTRAEAARAEVEAIRTERPLHNVVHANARDLDGLREQIATHGARRERAFDDAAIEMAELAQLAPIAIAAGMTKMEFSRLAQISRPTLDDLLR